MLVGVEGSSTSSTLQMQRLNLGLIRKELIIQSHRIRGVVMNPQNKGQPRKSRAREGGGGANVLVVTELI